MAKWAIDENEKTKVFYILIGIPCSGKSVYTNKLKKTYGDITVLSFDDIAHQVAKDNNVTYNDVFRMKDDNEKYYLLEEANERQKLYFQEVFETKPDIVVLDQTNIFVKTRNRFTDRARQNGYKVVYVFFDKPKSGKQAKVLFSRLDNRNANSDKFIGDYTIGTMYQDFEYPDLSVETPDEIKIIKDVWK